MALKRVTKRVEPQVMMEINTTPLIDVMLVLLIMLIITIPMKLNSVDLHLAVQSDSPPPPPIEVKPLSISINANNQILWEEKPVDLKELESLLDNVSHMKEVPELLVNPDNNANYGVVVGVMAAIQRHGLEKVGLQQSDL